MRKLTRMFFGLAGFALLALFAFPLHAQTYTDLYDFNCNVVGGCLPVDLGRLTQGLDGNLYGTIRRPNSGVG